MLHVGNTYRHNQPELFLTHFFEIVDFNETKQEYITTAHGIRGSYKIKEFKKMLDSNKIILAEKVSEE